MTNREDFGPNTWLVDELYRQYQEDPSSVSETWQEFFEDYTPAGDGQGRGPEPDAEALTRLGPAAEEAVQEAEAPPKPVPKKEPPPDQEEPDAEPEPEPEEEPEKEPEKEPVPAEAEPLKGIAAVIAKNMEASLGVPTATSFRQVSAKILEVNRQILQRHPQREQGGKVSYTHIIGYSIARALGAAPALNATYSETDGKPSVQRHEDVNLGLAVDVKRDDGTRTLIVPNIKNADSMDFAAFHRAYEDLIAKVTA